MSACFLPDTADRWAWSQFRCNIYFCALSLTELKYSNAYTEKFCTSWRYFHLTGGKLHIINSIISPIFHKTYVIYEQQISNLLTANESLVFVLRSSKCKILNLKLWHCHKSMYIQNKSKAIIPATCIRNIQPCSDCPPLSRQKDKAVTSVRILK